MESVKISDLINLLEGSKKELGDMEVFVAVPKEEGFATISKKAFIIRSVDQGLVGMSLILGDEIIKPS